MALSQQMSLRLSDEQRGFIQKRKSELQQDGRRDRVTEADAVRDIIEWARRAREAQEARA